MLQVLEEVLSENDDKTHVSLVFANNTEQDIILKDRLDALAKKHPNRFEVHYVVAQPADAASWKGHTGFINADIVKKHIPGPAEDVMVYVCGPPPFYKALSGSKAPDYSQGEVRPVPLCRTRTPHASADVDATLCRLWLWSAGRRAQGSGLHQGAGLQVLSSADFPVCVPFSPIKNITQHQGHFPRAFYHRCRHQTGQRCRS